jgi:hypothetical protein
MCMCLYKNKYSSIFDYYKAILTTCSTTSIVSYLVACHDQINSRRILFNSPVLIDQDMIKSPLKFFSLFDRMMTLMMDNLDVGWVRTSQLLDDACRFVVKTGSFVLTPQPPTHQNQIYLDQKYGKIRSWTNTSNIIRYNIIMFGWQSRFCIIPRVDVVIVVVSDAKKFFLLVSFDCLTKWFVFANFANQPKPQNVCRYVICLMWHMT